MSTRATVHFHYGEREATAIVYRHSDGYPDGLGKDLEEFLSEIETALKDTRFSNPSYLAAKWVVWDAARWVRDTNDFPWRKGEPPLHSLAFLGVGIVLRDPDDIEYRYHVRCGSGRPTITHEEV